MICDLMNETSVYPLERQRQLYIRVKLSLITAGEQRKPKSVHLIHLRYHYEAIWVLCFRLH